jgi:hypothetical protein
VVTDELLDFADVSRFACTTGDNDVMTLSELDGGRVVAIAGAHPVPFQFPAGRGSDIEILKAHQAPGHQHR